MSIREGWHFFYTFLACGLVMSEKMTIFAVRKEAHSQGGVLAAAIRTNVKIMLKLSCSLVVSNKVCIFASPKREKYPSCTKARL